MDIDDNPIPEDIFRHSFLNIFGCCLHRRYTKVCVETMSNEKLQEFDFKTNRYKAIRFVLPVRKLMDGQEERLIFNADYENLFNPSYTEIIQPRTDTSCLPSTSSSQNNTGIFPLHKASSATQTSPQASSSGLAMFSPRLSSATQTSARALSRQTSASKMQAGSSGTQARRLDPVPSPAHSCPSGKSSASASKLRSVKSTEAITKGSGF